MKNVYFDFQLNREWTVWRDATYFGELDVASFCGDATIVIEARSEPTGDAFAGDHPYLFFVRAFFAQMAAVRDTCDIQAVLMQVNTPDYDIHAEIKWVRPNGMPAGLPAERSIRNPAMILRIDHEAASHWIFSFPVTHDLEGELDRLRPAGKTRGEFVEEQQARLAADGIDLRDSANSHLVPVLAKEIEVALEEQRVRLASTPLAPKPFGNHYRLVVASTEPDKLDAVLKAVRDGMDD